VFPGYPVDHAPFWAGWFIYGRFAVVVFIVLSGFSLALSPARRGWRLDGAAGFARRRARRILPAYWAALAFSLAVAWVIVPQPGHGVPDAKSVVVNGLLVQNVVRAHSPNAAFWSMAVEAQLYLVFPLLLLMVRRWSPIVMVAVVTLVVASVGVVGPHIARLDTFVIQSAPDLAALFGVGVLAAGIVGARGRYGRSTACSGSTSRWARRSRAFSPGWPPAVRRFSFARSKRGRSATSAPRRTACT
jgi:peptidoglycan/LPS O-acetylase OafA/YrhL